MLYYDRNYQKWGHKSNAKYQFEWKKWNVLKQKNFIIKYKNRKRYLTFGKIEIQKHKLYHYKKPISLKDVHIENVLISNKISSGKKKY